jgi:hypothetical protein
VGADGLVCPFAFPERVVEIRQVDVTNDQATEFLRMGSLGALDMPVKLW